MSSPRASPPGSPAFQDRGEDKTSISSPQASCSSSPSPPRSPSFGVLSGDHYAPTSPSPGPLSSYPAFQDSGKDKMSTSSPHESHSPSPSPPGSPLFLDLSGEDYTPISSAPSHPCSGFPRFKDLTGDDNTSISSPHASRSPSPSPPGSPSFQGVSGEDYTSNASWQASPSPPSTGSKPRGGYFLLPSCTPRPGGDKKKGKPQAQVEFVLQSPQKARSVRKPGKINVPKPYTQDILLKNIDALWIRTMDPNDKEESWNWWRISTN